jgi:serine/threonine protein kinase
MPKKKNQSLYRLFRGGDIHGSGGTGCVYDLDDFVKLVQGNPERFLIDIGPFKAQNNNNAISVRSNNTTPQISKTTSFTTALTRQNTQSYFVGGNSSQSLSRSSQQTVAVIKPKNTSRKDVNNQILKVVAENSQDKVIKIILDMNHYFMEEREVINVKQMKNYQVYFPTMYQLGKLSWSPNKELLEKVQNTFKMKQCFMLDQANRRRETYNELYFVIMEKLEFSLKDVLDSKRTLAFDVFTEKMLNLVDRLTKMHKEGIMHCDIKPHNILLSKDGQLYFVDLGTVRTVSQFAKERTSMISKRYSVVFYPDEEIDRERQYDDIMLMQIDECYKYEICRIVGIKKLDYLFDVFRQKRENMAGKTFERERKTKARTDMYFFVDNFALAMTIVEFIVFYKNTFKIKTELKEKCLKELDARVKRLLEQVGSEDLKIPEESKIVTERDIQYSCAHYPYMLQEQARVHKAMNVQARAKSMERKAKEEHADLMKVLGF